MKKNIVLSAACGLDPSLTASGSNFTIATSSITPLTIALDTGNATFAGNVTMAGQLVVNTFIKLGDGGNGYFYSDTDGRTSFNGGNFYIQSGVGNYYNYATNQYHGDSASGSSHFFRSNALSGTNWAIDTSGNISASNLSGTNTGDQDLSGYVLHAATASILVRNTQTGSFVVNSQTGSLLVRNSQTGSLRITDKITVKH